MNKYISILLCTFLLLHKGSTAQTLKSFPDNDREFVQTLSTYLASNKRPQSVEAGEWVKQFLLSKNSPENIQLIRQTTNLMLERRIPLWPGFYNYIQYLKAADNNQDIDLQIVHKNHQLLHQFLKQNESDSKKNFNFYLDYLTNHYKNRALYSDKNKLWDASAPYKIETENGLPVYVFPKITLSGTTLKDTLTIFETQGKFYPFENVWKSNSGKITWERVGFDGQNVYATFGAYELDLSSPELNLDTATFHFKPFSQSVIQGKFADRLSTSQAVASSYPQLTSFDKVPFQISEEVKIESGIQLEGKKLFATSTGRAEPARLKLLNTQKEKILESEANRYMITDFKQIDAQGVKVNFCFMDSTSIFHPSSALSYNLDSKNLKITREAKSDARIPFVAPYFKMNLYVDQFEWVIGTDYIDMNSTITLAKLPSFFESFDYYVPGADAKYQQLLSVDPIESLAYYCESLGVDRITINEVSRAWNAGNYKSIESLVFKMMEDGYLYYDRETGMVDVYNKLFLHAKIRKDDQVNYDNIRLSAMTKGKAGKVLLKDKKLEIYGVEATNFIPKGNITLNPSSDTVYVSKNRDLVYQGMLTAGKFNFYSDSILFDYDAYSFRLDNIDSMLIMVPLDVTDSKGNQYYTEINTPIKNISGKIYIADPDDRNKSNQYTRYPYFDCNDTSTVTFNSGKFGDRYSPEQFKFKIHPFVLENLNTYNTDSIKLKGSLQTENIFEPFDTYISITEDRTLGLNIETGNEGKTIYNGKALFNGNIILDQNGLTAKGVISKHNLNIYSDSILFLPDSVYAVVSKWETIESDKKIYPIITAAESNFSWIPPQDSAFVEITSENDVLAYQNQARLEGGFYFLDKELKFSGDVSLSESTFKSDAVTLNTDNLNIRNTPFKIYSNLDNVFNSGQTDVSIDFNSMQAQVHTLNDTISSYPFNNIETNHDSFVWDIGKKSINIESAEVSDKYYEFTGQKFKGIRLKARQSIFDTESKIISLDGISEIAVADSRVIPFEQKLKITEGGLIDILENATVILNNDSSFHTIQNAYVEILDSNMMKGNGEIVLSGNNQESIIQINSFKTVEEIERDKKKEIKTYYNEASGFIEEEDRFKLSDNMYYKGKVFFNSLSSKINLDGFAKPQFATIPQTDWFKIEQSLDLNKSSLEIDSLKNELGQPVYTGLFLDMYDFQIYPRIIQSKESVSDRPLYLASGYMKNDSKKSSDILFGSIESLDKRDGLSSLLRYNDSTARIAIRGFFPLADLAPNLSGFYGQTEFKENQTEPLTIRGALSIDFMFLPEIQRLVSRFINDMHFNGKTLNLIKNTAHSNAIIRNIPQSKEAYFIRQDMEESNILNLPLDYPFNTVFSDVKLTFDAYEGTFKSIDTLNMLAFAGTPFIQKIQGYLEIGPRQNHDFINLYLSTANGQWMFIRYINGEMSIISSDAQFNTSLEQVKEKDRTLKSGKDIIYQISLSNPSLKDNFVSRIESFKESLPTNQTEKE